MKKKANRRERIFGEFLNFDMKMVVIAVMIRVWLFIPLANDNANHLTQLLIMISEISCNLQKCTLSFQGHNPRDQLHVSV